MVDVPELVITGLGMPPYSQRGAVQTLTPIAASSQLQRTVNGALLDVSDPIFRKYASQISCSDQQPPAFCWPGTTVVVDCVAELSMLSDDFFEYYLVDRPVVSYRIEGDWVFLRPQLTMKVISWSLNHDDWGRVIGWTIDLEEV